MTANQSSYCILRTEKLKTIGNISASLSHTYRTRPTHNADQARAGENRFQHQTPDEVLDRIKARLPAKRRKDAVLAIEYMVSSSPGHFKTPAQHLAYLKDAWEWIRRRHGAENVVSYAVHMDETTPHLVAYVVPLDESGKLNAKRFLGGKKVLSQMQTDFAAAVGERHRLRRGIERSTAKHTSIKEWYGNLNESMRPVEIPPAAVVPKVVEKRALRADVVETPEAVAARLNKGIEKLMAPTVARAKMADLNRTEVAQLRIQIADMQRRWQEANDRFRAAEDRARAIEEKAAQLREVYAALTPAQQKSVVGQARRNLRIKERCERLLSNFYDGITGAVGRFWRKAKSALLEAKGMWWDVSWAKLEKGYVEEERPRIGMREAFAVILEHSPGHANTTRKQAEDLLEEAARKDMEDGWAREHRTQLDESLPQPKQGVGQVERPRG